MVGYRYDRLCAVCSRIGQELFIRYDRLRWERFRVRNRLYRVGYGTVRYGTVQWCRVW